MESCTAPLFIIKRVDERLSTTADIDQSINQLDPLPEDALPCLPYDAKPRDPLGQVTAQAPFPS